MLTNLDSALVFKVIFSVLRSSDIDVTRDLETPPLPKNPGEDQNSQLFSPEFDKVI